jgi:hypothetical protein
MCLIAYAPKDRSQVPSQYIERAQKRNHDGFGIMYPSGDKVTFVKSASSQLEDFKAEWRKVPNRTPVAAHFRFATHGAKNLAMAHPFEVIGDKLMVMHNGMLDRYQDDFSDDSDTAIFIRERVKPLLGGDIERLNDPFVQGALHDWIDVDYPNKLFFMAHDGRTWTIKKDLGFEERGVWYSNEYSIAAPVTRKFDSVLNYSEGTACAPPYYGGTSMYAAQKESASDFLARLNKPSGMQNVAAALKRDELDFPDDTRDAWEHRLPVESHSTREAIGELVFDLQQARNVKDVFTALEQAETLDVMSEAIWETIR